MITQNTKQKKMKKIRQSEDQKTLSRLEMSVQTAKFIQKIMLLHIFVQLLMEHRRKNNRGYSSENVRNTVKKNVCLLKGLLRQDIQGKTADRISILMKKCGMAFMQMLRNIFRICRLWAGLLRFRMLQQNGCSICAVYIWIILRET